jgi:hypothetical protein
LETLDEAPGLSDAFSGAVGFLPGGSRQAAYLKSYGVTDERIQIAQMTVDVAAIAAFAKRFGDAQRRRGATALGSRRRPLLFSS